MAGKEVNTWVACWTLNHKVKETENRYHPRDWQSRIFTIIRLVLASINPSGSGPSMHQDWRRKQERHGPMGRPCDWWRWNYLCFQKQCGASISLLSLQAEAHQHTLTRVLEILHQRADFRDDSAPSPSPQKCNIMTSNDTQLWYSSVKPAELLEQSILPLLPPKG